MRYFLEPLIGALFTLWLLSHAHAGETCSQDGRYLHCWDTRSGNATSTTEFGEGGYAHSWTPDGRAITHWDHNGSVHSWRTH